MTESPKLFMLLLGCKPTGRFTEQHDIYFDIGTDLKSLVPHLRDFWPEGGEKLHIDAWREVMQVDSFRVDVISRSAAHQSSAQQRSAKQPSAHEPSTPQPSAHETPTPQPSAHEPSTPRLFFINLGGYKPDEFDEFHYKMIVAAPDKGEAVRRSKETAFYRHTGFSGAESHIDDKYGVDVDDVYAIEDILPPTVKDRYTLRLTHDVSIDRPDPIRLGYFQLHKL